MARATITQVARHAGVSIASASRALNKHSVSAATLERVRAAAAELGYVADASARSLKLGRTMQLAYAVADIGNPVYVEMMATIESVVSDAGYRLVVSKTGDAVGTVELVRELRRGHVDGMILSPLRVTDGLIAALEEAPVPTVVLGRLPDGAAVDTVRADSAAGMALVVDHLVELGRRRLAFLNGPADTTPGRLRRDGFAAAVAAHGDLETVETEARDFTIAAGAAAAEALLRAEPRLDAIVAANDLIGIGVLHAAADAGLRVPDELAVTGVDDTELARVTRPELTSVALGSAERGRAAAELLLARIADPARERTSLTVEPRLLVRGSTIGVDGRASAATATGIRSHPAPESAPDRVEARW